MNEIETFHQLKTILQPYEPALVVQHNKPDNYYLNTPVTPTNKKTEFFGAVQMKKSYVAFHLMPVYYYPELLNKISDGLKACMQGKSCFNFKKPDEKLFKELSVLTKKSFDKYKSEKKV